MIKLLTFIICILLLLYNYIKDRVVSSSSMWIFCYILIFIIYPLYSDINYVNSVKIDYCSLIGIIVFAFGFLFANKFKIILNNVKKTESKTYTLSVEFKIPFIFFCFFSVISLIIILRTIGSNNISKILSGTLTSKQISLGRDINTNPLVFSMHLLVPCILTMWISSKNKKQKFISILSLLVYIVETLLFGFTRLFLITILGILFFYEVKNIKKSKQVAYIFVSICLMSLLMVFLNFIRNLGISSAIRFKDYLNLDFIFESTDFSASYRFLNELLKYDSPFIKPIVYLKPFFAFIPRSVWLEKPEPLSMQILKYTNPWLVSTGFSTAGNSVLGEGYSLLGYYGMFLNCFLWGYICVKLDIKYKNRLKNNDYNSILNIYYYVFSVFVVISGQRGDWSQYMTIVLWFYFLPIYLFSKIDIKLD